MRAIVRLGAEIAASQNGQTAASIRTWREQAEQVIKRMRHDGITI
jgi:hypothetical protein